MKSAQFVLPAYVALATLLPALTCKAADSAATTATWLKLSPATSPPARSGPGMAYDPVQKLVVLFGGIATGHKPEYLSDTWAFNGTTWAELQPSDSPPPSQQAGMAYDFAARQIVLFSGIGRNSTTLFDWTQLSPTAQPGSASNLNAVYDPQLKGIVMLAGSEMGETWEWNRNTHHFGSYCQSPPPRVPGLQSAAAMLVEKTGCPMSRPRLET